MRHEKARAVNTRAEVAAGASGHNTRNSTKSNPWAIDARRCDDLALAIWHQQAEAAIALADEDCNDAVTASNTRAVASLMLDAIDTEQRKRRRVGFRMAPIDRGFTREYLDELRLSIDLIRLIESDGIALRRSGQSWRGLCPWHNDRSPSLVVWPDDGRWRCFGCGNHGDAITWFQLSHNVESFRDAVTWLARAYGVPMASKRSPEIVLI